MHVFFFKQKTAYEMRISDWSSDVCSSDLYDSANAAVDEDGTNRRDLYVDSTNTESNTSVYQEFKFNGSTDRLDWVAGASYFRESADQTSEVNTYTDAVDTIVRNLGMGLPQFVDPQGRLFGLVSDVATGNGSRR